jgi:hypothetical protein
VKAIIAYRRLIELAPQDRQTYYNLGVALKKCDSANTWRKKVWKR